MKTYKIAIILISLISSFITYADVVGDFPTIFPSQQSALRTTDGAIINVENIKKVDYLYNYPSQIKSINFIEMIDGQIIYGEELNIKSFQNKILPYETNDLSNGGINGGGG